MFPSLSFVCFCVGLPRNWHLNGRLTVSQTIFASSSQQASVCARFVLYCPVLTLLLPARAPTAAFVVAALLLPPPPLLLCLLLLLPVVVVAVLFA